PSRVPPPPGRLGRPRAARAHAGARGLGGREVASRRAGDGGAARVARRSGARVPCRLAAALLRGGGRAARLGPGLLGGGGGTRGRGALAARRRRAPARPTPRRAS